MHEEPGTIVLSILEAVAAAERTDPLDLPPLSEVVDPESLNMLFDPSGTVRAPRRISFDYAGYEVTVERDHGVTVVPAGPAVERTDGVGPARPVVSHPDKPLAE